MNSRAWGALSLGMCLALCVGCQQKPPPQLRGTLSIKGSNTFGEELGPKLMAGYKQRQPDVSVNLESKGTASGFTALIDGQCDIASSSRLPTAEETRAATAKGIQWRDDVVGYYGVAVVVNSGNRVKELSGSQVRDVFTGAITNWEAVGGASGEIHLYIRDPVAATNLGFRELAMENRPYAVTATKVTSYTQIAEAVAKDPMGIGYASMGKARHNGVRALGVDGVEPTLLTVNEGHYPYIRILRLYTNKATENLVARDFIRFAQSAEGQQIVDDMGFVRRLERRLSTYDHD